MTKAATVITQSWRGHAHLIWLPNPSCYLRVCIIIQCLNSRFRLARVFTRFTIITVFSTEHSRRLSASVWFASLKAFAVRVENTGHYLDYWWDRDLRIASPSVSTGNYISFTWNGVTRAMSRNGVTIDVVASSGKTQQVYREVILLVYRETQMKTWTVSLRRWSWLKRANRRSS